MRLGEVTLRLSDTAGLRETEDRIEQIGVRIAKEKLEQLSATGHLREAPSMSGMSM